MATFSKFFSFEELTDSEGHPSLVPQNRIDAKKYELAGKRLSKLLESIRQILGDKPIKATSGFRNKELNAAVGSMAKNSAHQRFMAVDVVPSNMSIKEALTALIAAYKGGLLPDLCKVIREDHKGILHIEVKMRSDEATTFYTTKDNVIFNLV